MSDDPQRSPPDSEVGAFIRRLWLELLRLESLDERRNFFEAGGDSMSMVHMLVAVSKEFDCEFDYEAFVRAPTLAKLEALVDQVRRGKP